VQKTIALTVVVVIVAFAAVYALSAWKGYGDRKKSARIDRK
jgi:type II secretory pathway pseudopilin PulG